MFFLKSRIGIVLFASFALSLAFWMIAVLLLFLVVEFESVVQGVEDYFYVALIVGTIAFTPLVQRKLK